MKKIFTIIALALATMGMSAQSLCFADAEGNEIPSGTTLTMNHVEGDDFGYMIPLEGVTIKNNTGSNVTFKLIVNIEAMENGSFSCCFGTQCLTCNVGITEIEGLSIDANNIEPLANTEWLIDEGKYGTLKTTLAIETTGFGSSKQSEIKVNYVYDNPTLISSMTSNETEVLRRVDVTGRTTNAKRGLIIEQLSDGTVRKIIK